MGKSNRFATGGNKTIRSARTSDKKRGQEGAIRGLVNVEDFFEFLRFGAVVGVGGHDVFHVGPPAFADGGVGDVVPSGFVFDFDVGEELAGFGVEEDGVVVDAVVFEDLL